ncbi:isochorismatase family protein [Cellulomonas humilata]|uniref:Isochorismatase family protein n=1 Tax=Cellulomonas humilata TaxID=144055 RepID=A0A7Y6DY95_9CELL|nr:isochorismatase family protein [Cellulomonas humilata]NUU18220.1 isochorismatase family protein [Cellulomonas humilata]
MHVTGTTPYPWPFDGDLDGTRTALLVVLPAGDCVLAAPVEPLASAVRAAGGRVIVVRTTAPAPDSDAGPHPHGLPADLEMQAGGIDGFYASDLDLVLRTGRTRRLVVVGVGLETCVHSTLRDANDRGYECLLVVDACVPIDPSLVAASISSIEMSGGIFGAVGYSTDVVEALAPQPALR